MCELLGLCGSTPFAADVTMRAFGYRDQRNADGWGLGWYVDGSLALVKEATPWRVSPYATFLADYERVRSTVFMAHVRRATVGRAGSRANAHPFEREIGGRPWAFAHNGTVRGELTLGRYHPIGETDSERLFCHLADGIMARGGHLDDRPGWRWLGQTLRSLNDMGKLNALLTDGQRLFAYRDTAGFKGLSMRLVGFHDGEEHHLDDPDFEIDLHAPPGDRVCAVATYPLDGAGWHDVRPGELLVIERGRLIWSSARRLEEAPAGRRRAGRLAEGVAAAARPGRLLMPRAAPKADGRA